MMPSKSEDPRVVVDAQRCIGAGLCEEVAGDVFRVSTDGLSEPVDRSALSDLIAESVDVVDRVTRAVESCPVQAITFERPDPR